MKAEVVQAVLTLSNCYCQLFEAYPPNLFLVSLQAVLPVILTCKRACVIAKHVVANKNSARHRALMAPLLIVHRVKRDGVVLRWQWWRWYQVFVSFVLPMLLVRALARQVEASQGLPWAIPPSTIRRSFVRLCPLALFSERLLLVFLYFIANNSVTGQ